MRRRGRKEGEESFSGETKRREAAPVWRAVRASSVSGGQFFFFLDFIVNEGTLFLVRLGGVENNPSDGSREVSNLISHQRKKRRNNNR